MALKWTDVQDIALELLDKHPAVDPKTINFVDLRRWVMELEDFADDPDRCGEKVLEAIQMCWLEERE